MKLIALPETDMKLLGTLLTPLSTIYPQMRALKIIIFMECYMVLKS